jgi:hypothetical protein
MCFSENYSTSAVKTNKDWDFTNSNFNQTSSFLNVQANVCSSRDLTSISMENGTVAFLRANSFSEASGILKSSGYSVMVDRWSFLMYTGA